MIGFTPHNRIPCHRGDPAPASERLPERIATIDKIANVILGTIIGLAALAACVGGIGATANTWFFPNEDLANDFAYLGLAGFTTLVVLAVASCVFGALVKHSERSEFPTEGTTLLATSRDTIEV